MLLLGDLLGLDGRSYRLYCSLCGLLLVAKSVFVSFLLRDRLLNDLFCQMHPVRNESVGVSVGGGCHRLGFHLDGVAVRDSCLAADFGSMLDKMSIRRRILMLVCQQILQGPRFGYLSRRRCYGLLD